MNYKLVKHTIGLVLLLEAVAMLPSVIIAYFSKEYIPFRAFILSEIILFTLSFVLIRTKYKSKKIFAREGIAVVALSWILISVFGAMPFFLSGVIPNYADAFFEAVSGFTTTGVTILTDVSVLPKSIAFWRAFTHWLGGMGILVFVLAFVTVFGGRAIYIVRAESAGPQPGGKVVSRMRESISITYLIYIGLTIIMFLLLMLTGMKAFDSILLTFSVAGTGGFSHVVPSVEYFNNPAAEWIMGIFMFLFSLNFSLYFFIIIGKIKYVVKNEELRWFIAIVGISFVLVFLNIYKAVYESPSEALRASFFQVTSVISTTGLATTDFDKWPEFSKIILFTLMFIGGSAGSTAGGLKVSRVVLMVKNTKRHLKSILHPRLYAVVRMDSEVVDELTLDQMGIYLINYFLILIISFLLISFNNFDFEVTISSVVTCLNNVGPGFGLVGPYGGFAEFSIFSKLVFSFIMLIGRLEIFPMLLLFSPELWRK